jgi:hypothetical protein
MGEHESADDKNIVVTPQIPTSIQRFGYKDIDSILRSTYNYKESNNSTICDILAMYLKGQKILYIEAKTLCEQRLNYLMLPAIFITSVCSILSLVLKDIEYGPTIVSSLNGFTAFILALISFMKLDAKAEAHRISAYKFDKLQSNLEFNSGKNLFISSGMSEELGKVIRDAENNVREIKETNQFILPEIIRYSFPRLYSINVFAEVKMIQNREMIVVNDLKEIFNEMFVLKDKINRSNIAGQEPNMADLERMKVLDESQQSKTNRIIRIKDDYLKIDEEFEKEMKMQRERMRTRCQPCGWLKT